MKKVVPNALGSLPTDKKKQVVNVRMGEAVFLSKENKEEFDYIAFPEVYECACALIEMKDGSVGAIHFSSYNSTESVQNFFDNYIKDSLVHKVKIFGGRTPPSSGDSYAKEKFKSRAGFEHGVAGEENVKSMADLARSNFSSLPRNGISLNEDKSFDRELHLFIPINGSKNFKITNDNSDSVNLICDRSDRKNNVTVITEDLLETINSKEKLFIKDKTLFFALQATHAKEAKKEGIVSEGTEYDSVENKGVLTDEPQKAFIERPVSSKFFDPRIINKDRAA